MREVSVRPDTRMQKRERRGLNRWIPSVDLSVFVLFESKQALIKLCFLGASLNKPCMSCDDTFVKNYFTWVSLRLSLMMIRY